MTSLSIALVNTQMPENIGAAARAMMNFGLKDLRLVAPREEWPNKRAYDLAAHAGSILDNARVFASTREAVADMGRVYAATARSREMIKPVFTPTEAMRRIHKEGVPAVVLFGPERTGLTNDDVTLADAIITIPTAAENASLNVAQSVVVLAYEFFVSSRGATFAFSSKDVSTGSQTMARDPALTLRGPQDDGHKTTGPAASPIAHKSQLATKEELQTFFDHLERELDTVDFWKVAEKKQKMWLNLRNIFTRASLTDQEVRSLHGVVAELAKANK